MNCDIACWLIQAYLNCVRAGVCAYHSHSDVFIVTGSMDKCLMVWNLQGRARAYRFVGHKVCYTCRWQKYEITLRLFCSPVHALAAQ